MMFLWLVLLIPLAVFLFARPGAEACCGSVAHEAHPPGAVPADEDPIEIARKRLARGEITPAHYDEIRRVIGA